MWGVLALVIDEKEQSLDWTPDLVTPPGCSSHCASVLSVPCNVLTFRPRRLRPQELLRGSGVQESWCAIQGSESVSTNASGSAKLVSHSPVSPH